LSSQTNFVQTREIGSPVTLSFVDSWRGELAHEMAIHQELKPYSAIRVAPGSIRPASRYVKICRRDKGKGVSA